MNILERALAWGDTWSNLIPLLTALIVFRKNKMPVNLRVLTGYLVMATITFGYSNYLADNGVNNMFLYHLFAPVEFLLLSVFFIRSLPSRPFHAWVYAAIVFFFLLALFNAFYWEGTGKWNGNIMVIEFLLLNIFCFVYFFHLTRSDQVLTFTTNGTFWIVSGIFVYCAASIAIVAFYNFTYPGNKKAALFFWEFQVLMYIVKQLLFTRGILCFKLRK